MDWKRCIFGSSNLTSRGLGIGSNYNYELNGSVDSLCAETTIYLRKILAESCLMTDDMYNDVILVVDELPQIERTKEFDIERYETNNEYLISSLPMSKSIERLFHLIINGFDTDDDEEKNCAIHDYVLFSLSSDYFYEEFLESLSRRFFHTAFISALLHFIDDDGRYFGEVKNWIQANCKDVPVPSRRDLTGNIQVLYHWIEVLGAGKYFVDRPNYSQRIGRVKNG